MARQFLALAALVVGAVLLMGHGVGAGQVVGYGIALAGMLAYKCVCFAGSALTRIDSTAERDWNRLM